MADTKAKEVKAAAPTAKPKKKLASPGTAVWGMESTGSAELACSTKKLSIRFLTRRHPRRQVVLQFLIETLFVQVVPEKLSTVVKAIDGEKNGDTRAVLLEKRKANYQSQILSCLTRLKNYFKDHKGHLQVNWPLKINACQSKQINQIFTVTTFTKLDLSYFKVPKHMKDSYFKKKRKKIDAVETLMKNNGPIK
ncbi:60S ribosomal protein L6 [Copidosoma floridanum]|uniref:60S ribosomal protein L6 n=1 Tax=Copidosoma floridanum TaxID=29053 RepID=UPI000C6F4FB8|nr:60S ribosomal protein L6 [Copidosoma floridanum]